MAAINFPNSPAPGDRWPVPAVPGLPVYTWDGEKWTTISSGIGGGALAPPSVQLPLMDAGAAVGSAIPYSREDHVHPTDTTRAPLASPLFTGDARVPTPAAGNATASIPNTAWVSGYYLPITNPSVNGSLTVSGAINVAGTTTTNGLTVNAPGTVGQAGPGTTLISAPAGNQPVISFLVAGAFGGNLGMDSAGNFYVGGWSYGATAYKIWTSRDFSAPVYALRHAYAGDAQAFGTYGEPPNTTGGYTEPFAGAVVVGSFTDNSSYFYLRFRYLQMVVAGSGWITVSIA